MADLKTFKIDVAMDIRAYGYVEIEAENIEKAVELATPSFIKENFDSHGYGADDFDYSSPRDIWLGDFECEETGEEGFVEKDLPNSHIHNGLAHDAGPELLEALKECAELLFHLGTAGKNTSQDEVIDAVRERALSAIAKAEGTQSDDKPSASRSSGVSAASSTASTSGR